MKYVLKTRKNGFTLVELLIVIMIIAILAGMMMLATGSATDVAEATRVVNDLRSAKAAAILIFTEEGLNWNWVQDGEVTQNSAVATSFDQHMDRPLFTTGVYRLYLRLNKPVDVGGGQAENKSLIGFDLLNSKANEPSVRKKLAKMAERAGLYNYHGNIYDGSDSARAVYMILH